MEELISFLFSYINSINFASLRQIPIISVAERLGIQLIRTGSGTWQMRDPEDPRERTSLTIFEKTNSFYRFSGKEQGGVHGGSPIDLVQHIRECSLREATDFLLFEFPSYI